VLTSTTARVSLRIRKKFKKEVIFCISNWRDFVRKIKIINFSKDKVYFKLLIFLTLITFKPLIEILSF